MLLSCGSASVAADSYEAPWGGNYFEVYLGLRANKNQEEYFIAFLKWLKISSSLIFYYFLQNDIMEMVGTAMPV